MVQLKRHNTLRVAARVAQLIRLRKGASLETIRKRLLQAKRVFILGGGSNVVLRDHHDATVLLIDNLGIKLISQEANRVIVQASAGEPWHEFVQYCLAKGWNGLENLSLIPGKVGASPIQNIGAYGVEVAQLIDCVQVWHWPTGRVQIWTAQQCKFNYRDSIFKHGSGQDWVVLAVRFNLSTSPAVRLGYADLQTQLDSQGIDKPTPSDVANAVTTVRQRKLPDPAHLPNAGSFFKNPVISRSQFTQLKSQFPALPQYPAANGVKTSAAWLIEQSGWKGKRIGAVGMHVNHALVLVNYADATAQEIAHVASAVSDDVNQRFGVRLEAEPMFW